MRVGKLENHLLEKLVINKIKYRRADVVSRSAVGEDCGAIDFGESLCVFSTDPITAASEDLGRLAVLVSLNDVASSGAEPIAITLTLLLPTDIEEEDIERIMEQAAETAEKEHVEIAGGHTEITNAVGQPIAVVTAIGKGAKREARSKALAFGDKIIMTKWAGLEGTGIIAKDVKQDILSSEELVEALALSEEISAVKEGRIAGRLGFKAMHDVTEGGILGGIWELSTLGAVGCLIDEEAISIHPVTKKLARGLGFNPLRLISSGSMIIIADDKRAENICKALDDVDIKNTVIGEIRDKNFGIKIRKRDGNITDIEPPEADEIYRVIGQLKLY